VTGVRPVVIDARAAARARIGGVERWAVEMVTRLPALRPGGYVVAQPPPALAHLPGHLWEQAALPLRARRARAALVYAPANLAPLAWPRNVVMVHDAAVIRHPEWYSRTYARLQRLMLPVIARRAVHVVTPSSFARAEVIELLGADPEKVSVIAGGVDARFHPHADPDPALRPRGLARPYVLTVGTPGPRKNLSALSAAAERLAAEGIDLVAAGGGRRYIPDAAAPGLRPLGYVPDAELPGLYAGARAFVLPSVHEGFGLPCLEAMACGVPVVAARTAALGETCGGAALMVNPEDGQEGFADALMQILHDDGLRAQLREAGLARAAGLTWDRAARATDALLARVAG
jgi:glycosyltransferase involved in cell wall biosynthesis